MSPFRATAPLTKEWEHFEFVVEDGVATLTLDRPDKLNALTFDVYVDLRDLVTELPHRGDVKVLVLSGRGRGFCSGGDVEEIIGELQKMETAELLEFTRMTGAVVKALRECPIPVIAAVNGVAAGAGSVLALASDFRLLARSATGQPVTAYTTHFVGPRTGGELHIKSQLAEDGQVLISVTDAGVGLPTEKTDQIFNAFFTTKPHGTGLGLAITRSIVESHDGRIWATANSGPGTTFRFTLPQRRARHA